MLFSQQKKIEIIGIFEDLPGQIRLRGWQGRLKVGDCFTFALVEAAFDMVG